MEPEPDLAAEALRLLASIEAAEIEARLIGGMAIRLLAGERFDPIFEREIADLDFFSVRGAGRRLGELLAGNGYEPDERFNALNGARRLLFLDPVHGRQVDVFVGSFEMCHTLPLAERIAVRPHTLPAAELLMTKLQIVELNEKDRGDTFALLLAHEVAEADLDPAGADAIDATRIAALTSRDWGLQRTFELNLQRLREAAPGLPLGEDRRAAIADRIDRLAATIETAPKSRRWKLRERVGERVRWYEEPEEVDRG
ncbi:MAG TPA: hypothetical protein VHI77_02885 [Solirubrobacterales bacterium]|nr:hypothetical protein [Solirubrobacterales bacterium]